VAVYNQGVFRTGTYGGGSGPDPLVPEPVSAQIIQELPKQSAVLQRARHITMSSKTLRQPVLDVLPVAYFVSSGNDTGLKQTTQQQWKGITLVAEEIAAIVPIPESYLADVDVPMWGEIMPRLVEAIGSLIDAAAIFGTGRPSTWNTSLYEGAVAAGNTYAQGTGVDLAQDVTQVAQLLARDGYSVDGFIVRPGFNWQLVGMRSTTQNYPIYQPDLQGTPGGSLYGYPLTEIDNGSWVETEAQLIAGDWDNALLGLRQDISFKIFTEGVISNDAGGIVLNLMQQDAVAMRVTMRVAFATANPVTKLNSNGATRYPFAVLTSAGANS
jgi:HK97 family phage major capsid protein